MDGPYLDRIPPQDIEAERCLISSLMLSMTRPEFELGAKTVIMECFYLADHQIMFDILREIWNQGGPCDAVILRDRLERKQLLEEVGGAAYLAQIMNTMPSAAHGEHYAKIVREKYLLRELIAQANEVIRKSYSPLGIDGPLAIAALATRRFSAIAATGEAEKIVTLGSAVQGVIDRHQTGECNRLISGINELDRLIGGIPTSKFTLIGARPGMGKSLILKQLLRNVAKSGYPVGIISIEETREKIAENCLSAISGIDNNRIAYGHIAQEEWPSIAQAQIKIEALPFHIADAPCRLAEVETAITTMAIEHECKMIAIDYIQCIDAGGENENREITLVSRAIKSAFKRLNVAGVAAVQLNRGPAQGDGRRPTLKDLRGSGSLEQDGDLIILLHSEDYYRREKGDPTRDGKLELIVAKNKDGPQADIPVHACLRTQEIRDWHQDIGGHI